MDALRLVLLDLRFIAFYSYDTARYYVAFGTKAYNYRVVDGKTLTHLHLLSIVRTGQVKIPTSRFGHKSANMATTKVKAKGIVV